MRGELVTKNCAYGYMLDEQRNMVLDPPAAKVVHQIFSWYAAKKSLADITHLLYMEKQPAPAVWKKMARKAGLNPEFQCVWQKCVILSILKNEQYLGTYIAGKGKMTGVGSKKQILKPESDWIRIPNHHPAIVSQELWDAAQAQLHSKGEPLRGHRLTADKRYAAVMTLPLKGKVVCGSCGHTMRISATKNAAFHCWFTMPAPDTACHRLRILKSELEAMVLKSIKQRAKTALKTGLSAETIQAACAPATDEYAEKIERLRDEKQRLYEALVQGDVSSEEYKIQKATVETKLAETLQVQSAILSEYKKGIPDADTLAAAQKALKGKKLTETLVDLLIDKVLVWPGDKIEIVWKADVFPQPAFCR